MKFSQQFLLVLTLQRGDERSGVKSYGVVVNRHHDFERRKEIYCILYGCGLDKRTGIDSRKNFVYLKLLFLYQLVEPGGKIQFIT